MLLEPVLLVGLHFWPFAVVSLVPIQVLTRRRWPS